MSESLALHASCIVVEEAGILIRGPSGSGKSSLALALLERAKRDRRFGNLVADDRAVVTRRSGRLVCRPHPAVAGLVEMRGLGIVRRPHEAAAVVRLVVERGGRGDRLPAPNDLWTEIIGVRLPRMPAADCADPVSLVFARLDAFQSAFDDTPVTIT